MTRHAVRWAGALAAAMFVPCATPAFGDELTGEVRLGWRNVSVDGADNKFRQHVNLDDGARLLSLSASYDAQEPRGRLPDKATVELGGFGGDPFQSLRIDVRRFGSYRLRYDRREADYFYDDLLIDPAEASVAGSTGGDFHRYDLGRVQENLQLDMQVSSRATATIGFDRYSRSGDSTTTRDVQRDEFELDQPIDENLQTVSIGFQYRWDLLSVSIEEGIRDYESDGRVFLPGFSPGENDDIDDATTLDFYRFDSPYDYDSHETRLSARAQPVDRLDLRLATSITDLSLDLQAMETARGVDFLGQPFEVDESGNARIERDLGLYEFDAGYLLSDRWQLTAAIARRELDQNGQSQLAGESAGRDWSIETTGTELGLQFAISSELAASIGWSSESRETSILDGADTLDVLQSIETDRDGLFIALDYQPYEGIKLNATIEDNRIADPFTLASPTDTIRYRLRGRFRFGERTSLTFTHKLNKLENRNTSWRAEQRQSDLRASYRGDRLQVAGSVSIIDLTRDFEQLVTGGFRQDLFAVAYRGDTMMLDGSVHYAASDRIALGASMRDYDNDGSFPLQRRDLSAYFALILPADYRLRFTYRNVDYGDSLETYEADIYEMALAMAWQ